MESRTLIVISKVGKHFGIYTNSSKKVLKLVVILTLWLEVHGQLEQCFQIFRFFLHTWRLKFNILLSQILEEVFLLEESRSSSTCAFKLGKAFMVCVQNMLVQVSKHFSPLKTVIGYEYGMRSIFERVNRSFPWFLSTICIIKFQVSFSSLRRLVIWVWHWCNLWCYNITAGMVTVHGTVSNCADALFDSNLYSDI